MNDPVTHISDGDCTWQPSDFWLGLMMMTAGILYIWLFFELATSEHWVILLIGGLGWIMPPILIFIGGNAAWQGLKVGLSRLGGKREDS